MAVGEFGGIEGQQVGAEFTAEGENGAQIDLDDLIMIVSARCRGIMLLNGGHSPHPNPHLGTSRWDVSSESQRSSEESEA